MKGFAEGPEPVADGITANTTKGSMAAVISEMLQKNIFFAVNPNLAPLNGDDTNSRVRADRANALKDLKKDQRFADAADYQLVGILTGSAGAATLEVLPAASPAKTMERITAVGKLDMQLRKEAKDNYNLLVFYVGGKQVNYATPIHPSIQTLIMPALFGCNNPQVK